MNVPEKLSAAVLFEPAPDKWACGAIRTSGKTCSMPLNLSGFQYLRKNLQKNSTIYLKKSPAKGLSVTCRPRLSRYGSGGMSGGQVSGAFWLNEVLPMLVERLVTYSLPAAADPAPAAGAPLSDTAQAYGTGAGIRHGANIRHSAGIRHRPQDPAAFTWRKIRMADRPAIGSILQDAEVMYAWEHAFSDDEVTDWMEQNLMRYDRDGYSYWAVMEKSTGDLVGLCRPPCRKGRR